MGGSWETALQLLERLGIEGEDRVKQAKFLVLEQKFLEVRTINLGLVPAMQAVWQLSILPGSCTSPLLITKTSQGILYPRFLHYPEFHHASCSPPPHFLDNKFLFHILLTYGLC